MIIDLLTPPQSPGGGAKNDYALALSLGIEKLYTKFG